MCFSPDLNCGTVKWMSTVRALIPTEGEKNTRGRGVVVVELG